MRNFILFSLGSMYAGMGMETFAHTWHGDALIVAGLVLMIKIFVTIVRSHTQDSYAWVYCLQIVIALMGFHSWVKDARTSVIITTVTGIAGFAIIYKGAIEAEVRKEREEKKYKELNDKSTRETGC